MWSNNSSISVAVYPYGDNFLGLTTRTNESLPEVSVVFNASKDAVDALLGDNNLDINDISKAIIDLAVQAWAGKEVLAILD